MLTYEQLAGRYGIGITGGIATGKSTVSSILSAAGHKVYDADSFARLAVAPNSETVAKIVALFGDAVVDTDGCLQREQLRAAIFADPDKRKALDSIMHPRILQLLQEQLRHDVLYRQPELWFYDAALLIETGSHKNFRSVWLTHCQPATQVKRLLARNFTKQEAMQAIQAQLPDTEKRKHADFLINTDEPLPSLKNRVEALLSRCARDLLV
ncbi:MAG: dephospho-CoA kinase [Pseudomonadota bacterium]|nr:dephospho-CoA kinase [Pseudomonadota bacterium]